MSSTTGHRAPERESTTRPLRLSDVMHITALSRSAAYVLMATAGFPRPVRIGARAVRWIEREVLDFIASRPLRQLLAVDNTVLR